MFLHQPRSVFNKIFTHQLRRYIKTDVNQVRSGMYISLDDKLWYVTNKEHSIAGRGSAKIKLDLNQINGSGKKFERFKPGDQVEVVQVKPSTFQYLYSDETSSYLLNLETYDQISLPTSSFTNGEKLLPFLLDSMEVTVNISETLGPISFSLPDTYIYEVEETNEAAKQANKGVASRPAKLTNGCTISLPEFIKKGDRVIVDLNTLKYVGRA